MLAREVSRVIPGGHRQSLDDDAPRGASAPRAYAYPPRRVISCDAQGESLRDASIASSNRFICKITFFRATRSSSRTTTWGLL